MFQARPDTWIAKISFCTGDGARLTFENRFRPVRITQFNYISISTFLFDFQTTLFVYVIIK